MSASLAAGLLAFIGLVHSVFGEIAIVTPLLRNRSWSIGIPRRAADRVIRFAWHLTTLAWLGLAAALIGVDIGVAFGAVALISGATVLVMLPAHPAWPFFIAAGLYALDAAGALPRPVLVTLTTAAALVAVGGAAAHLAWALGWRVGSHHVLPERPGTSEPIRRVGPVPTILVAAAAGGLAWLLTMHAWGEPAVWQWWGVAVAGGLLVLRVLGDGRYVGVFKRVRDTPFSRRDDMLYTPLFGLLAAGAVAAAHLAGLPH